ncbi:Scn11a [Symbiodinium pilosum]|uniref:Scn11a protein n=1 Tax=Symbiodinium pilosum TaxID=2952 RepID=A0A812IWH4_SYMPI|nr:Scn11a [Symbiodinium pilosum]
MNKVPMDEDASEDNPTLLLLLDVIPSFVIVLSAAVAGLSADIESEHPVWKVLEICFTVFFIGEIMVKLKVFGFREFLRGADWYWSWFDIICVILAVVDISLTYSSSSSTAPPSDNDAGESASGTGFDFGLLKMLKLARLGRIVRLLKFKIFQELKLMIQGVFTGLRVLFWAVVLLFFSIYLLGVISRTLFSNLPEFETVPAAMFTTFRCFTDGCAAYDGTPLQERLRHRHGGIFMFAYMLLFLFVTIGIFNLIMAVFIDNVTDGSTKKRQRQLGENAPRTEWVIASALREIILTNIVRQQVEDQVAEEERNGVPGGQRRVSKLLRERLQALQEMYGYKPHTTQEYEEFTQHIREEMAQRDVVVTKEQFNHWLTTEKELIGRLEDSEIDLSCKFDLFDVLDADLSGELEFEEMIDGLLKCRGPASKTDIIAIRLKTSLGVKMLTKICEKLGVNDD